MGHRMVRAVHPTTIELTRDKDLTERGDCIIGVRADKGCSGLSGQVRKALRTDGAAVKITIEVDGMSATFSAAGDSRLTLIDPHEMVIRKSSFISDRTLVVGSDWAAKDVPRSLVERLKDPEARGTMVLEVSP
jgi:uncharacterized protein